MDVMSDRQKEILALAQVAGRVEVDDMAARFAVSPQTIRKDLNEICALNLLHRVHGGAVMVAGVENLRYESRRLLAQDEKRNIGRAAAALVPDNSSLFINIGTTTEAVAHHLRNRSDLLVITNNMNVANILRPIDSIDVIVVGGLVRHSDGGLVGETAVDFINQFKVDYAIIGTSAIDADGTLMDFDLREVKAAQAIIANARRVILVTDRMKLERTAPVRVAHLSQIHTFVTDSLPHGGVRDICRDHGVRIVEADEI